MIDHEKSLQTILDEALEISDARERSVYLSKTCGTDPTLRQEVEELIHAHAAAPQFLPARPADPRIEIGLANTVMSAACHVPVREKSGDRIGRYKLLEQIGEGGCGVVYMADQEEPVRRCVALKVIKLGMDTEQVVVRFEAERQALAMMDHPNIAKVFDAGTTETGRPYFVMELVRGNKITEYCDEHELSTRERLELFIQVCQAVQHAHQKGIIHRDLKPSNILVTVNDLKPVPKVIDFGIAKATEGRLTDQTLFTAFNQFLGTPAYMSPEQTIMTSQDIDTRSDIYSLGVLLYELLTGKTPFDSKELLAAGLDEMRRTIREKEPLRPSTRVKGMVHKELTTTAKRRRSEPPKLIHLLRGDLDSIVGKCLEKDRVRRYETANGLAADLQRHLNNEPIIARPAGTIYRLRKVAQRNKWAFAAGIAITSALLLGTVVSSWLAVRFKRERQRSQRNLAHEYVANGTRLVNEGDLFGSLLWYAKALELDAGDPRREEPHRIRIASVLRQCPKLLDVFSHGDQLRNSEFSSDGNRLVTASDDRTARVWDVSTGQQLLLLQHDGDVHDARFSQDGLRVVTSSADKTARIWDGRTGELLRTLLHADGVWNSCFSPDGRLVATASEGQTVQLWDASTGTRVGQPLPHPSDFLYLNFSPDGRLLGSATWTGTACIWDVATGQKLGQFPHTTSQTGVAFSPDSQRLLTCEGDNLHVWDTGTLKEVSFSPIKYPNIMDFSFSPDGRAILTASMDFTAQTWDAVTGKPLFSRVVEHTGPITGSRISPDGRSFVTAGNDAIARVWSTATGQPISPPFKAILMIKQAHFNADGRRLLMKSCDHAARVWDLATGDLPGPSRPPVENEQRLISPNGQLLLSGGQSNIVWITDTQTGQNLAALPHPNGVVYASFSRDGRTVLTASESDKDELFLWEAPTGRRLNTVNMRATYRVLYAAFSPDNSRLLTCGLDYCAYLWNARTGQALSDQPLRHHNRVTWGSFSPDGRSVVTASWDKTVRVWDAATGKALTPPLQHKSIVASASWSADGKRLLTVTTDDYLHVWDLVNGEPLTPPRKIRKTEGTPAQGSNLATAVQADDLLPDKRPVSDLVLLSQMLAVDRIDSGGNVVPLQLNELTQASKELRQKYTNQFAASSSEAAAWHRHEAKRSKAEGNLKAAMFHLERAIALQPNDQALSQERAELATSLRRGSNPEDAHESLRRRIPPRDSKAGIEQIDLSPHYNVALQDFDFAGLPTGLQTLGGCRFDVRGLVQLYGTALKGEEGKYPERLTGIHIAQKCRRLQFLQATSWGVPDGVQVGSYVLHFADGQTRELPILCGRDLDSWWFWGLPKGSNEAESAITAWVGQNPAAAKKEAAICLYKSTRENPRPDVELVTIDFVSSLSFAAPFLVALTVE